MSIIVNGRGIPDKGCMNCHYRTGKYCGIKTENDYVYDNVFTYTRPKDCPITELVCCKDCKHNNSKSTSFVACVLVGEMYGREANNYCSLAEVKE